MVVSIHKRAIGVFSNRRDAEDALQELRASGFSMDRVSVIKRDADRRDDIAGAEVQENIGNKSDEGATAGAVSGGVLGGLTGLLVGLGTLAIPGIGPIMLAGAAATAIATTLAGAGIGAATGSLLGALIGLGIPEERARVYNERLERGDYLVIVDGTDAEIARVQEILHRRGVEEFAIYDRPENKQAVTNQVAGVTPANVVSNSALGTASRQRKRAVGVFPNRADAQAALTDLRDAGFPMSQISLIGKDANSGNVAGVGGTNVGTGNKADEGAKAGALTGGALGGLGGLLVGLGALAIPGIGPVIAGGAVATALATAATGGAIGAAAGGLTGGLVGLGIPENKARVYNDRLNRGDYLVIVDGTEDEVRHAEAILNRHRIQEFDIFDAADTTGVRGQDYDPGVRPAVGTASRQRRRAVGVFPNRADAQAALTDLRDAGFPMSQISLIGKDANSGNVAGVGGTNVGTGNKADEGAKAGALTGGALGGLGGLLVGLGALAIPGIGPVIAGGAVATALATAATGGAIGATAGGLTGGLVGLGIPENKARVYNDRLNRGDYLVIVDGSEDEVRHAQTILNRHRIQEFDIFDAADTTGVRGQDYDPGVRPAVGTASRQRKRAVGVFPNRADAQAALTDLRDAGFPMSQISLIGKDTNSGNVAGVGGTNVGTGNKADEGAKAGALTGGALGGLGGLLVGLGALAIPGIGPIIAGGAVATALATAAAGGAIGATAGGLTGGLVGLGIPENKARVYNDRLNRGDYLVIVDGTEDEVRHAQTILNRHRIQEFDIFDAADTTGVRGRDYDPGVRPALGTASIQKRRAVGVFPNRADAQAALTDLRDAGFPMSQISLIGKDTNSGNVAGVGGTNVGTGNKADEGAKAGALTGGALGGLGGLLVGLGALAIPGIGPVIAGGAVATALATAATGGAIGAAAGGLTGGLVGLGIPENKARVYNDRLNRGDYLVIVDGTEDEVRHAQTILNRHRIQEFDIFDAADTTGVRGRDYDPGVRREAPVVSSTSTEHQTGYDKDDPAVIIVDHRDETV